MNGRSDSQGAMFSLGDGLVGLGVAALAASEGRSQFAVLGRNPKSHSEVHLLEYRPELGVVSDLRVATTQDRLYKLGACRAAPGVVLAAGSDGSGEFFAVADASLSGVGEVASKEAAYRLTKEAFGRKAPISVLSKERPGFRVADFACKPNAPKVVLAADRTLMVRDLPQNRAEGSLSIARDGTPDNLACDPHSDRVAFSVQRSILVADLRTAGTGAGGLAVDHAHQGAVSSLEFNPNKNHTLLSASHDHSLKVWDLRKPELPILIFSNQSNPIENCRYNPTYDQLLLYSTSDGGMSLYQAGSASIQPTADLEDAEQADYVVATYEGCLDDVVRQVAWSHGDYWVFCGVSHSASVYCDIVPEREKQRIIL